MPSVQAGVRLDGQEGHADAVLSGRRQGETNLAHSRAKNLWGI
jgi:hypothetical protein